MTAGRSQEVDLDLLADYVGGALDGTPEQVVMERLIRTVPQWRDAHQALVGAMDPVQAALVRWGTEELTMPEDVTARLTAAFDRAALDAAAPEAVPIDAAAPEAVPIDAAAPEAVPPGSDLPDTVRPVVVPAGRRSPDGAGGGPTRPGRDRPAGPAPRPGGRPDSGSGAGERPGGSTDGGRPGTGRRTSSGDRLPGRGRRRWVRLAGPVMVTAAVVAFGVVGLTWLAPPDGGQNDSASTAGGAVPPVAAPEQATDAVGPRVLLDANPQQILSSGIDYRPDTLRAAVATLPRAAAGSKESGGPADSPGAVRGDRSNASGAAPAGPTPGGPTPDGPAAAGPKPLGRVPAGLQRLADRTALDTCLAAVTGEHGRGQLLIETVDYASFEGEPALIVVFADGTGGRWAWVSGPDCGLPGSAADTRHRARVG